MQDKGIIIILLFSLPLFLIYFSLLPWFENVQKNM